MTPSIVDNSKGLLIRAEKHFLQLRVQRRFRIFQALVMLTIIVLEIIEYVSFTSWLKKITNINVSSFYSNDAIITELVGHKNFNAFVVAFSSVALAINCFFIGRIWHQLSLVKSLFYIDMLLAFTWLVTCFTNTIPTRVDNGRYRCENYSNFDYGVDSKYIKDMCRSYLLAVFLGYLMLFSYFFASICSFRMSKVLKNLENKPKDEYAKESKTDTDHKAAIC